MRGRRRTACSSNELMQSAETAPLVAIACGGTGGHTSAPPILAGRRAGAMTFLHESNSIPGRANRWLGPRVDHVFVGFPAAAAGIRNHRVTVTGTPVRPRLRESKASECRVALGL